MRIYETVIAAIKPLENVVDQRKKVGVNRSIVHVVYSKHVNEYLSSGFVV